MPEAAFGAQQERFPSALVVLDEHPPGPRAHQVAPALSQGCGEPMTVGAITAELEVGQSTVSEHLKVLAGVRFVLAERRGTAAYYRVNDACVRCFPSAADIVMGRPVPTAPFC
jgi:DNA-binding transcriptional ArsR family regulator